jgi:hypothetical protein
MVPVEENGKEADSDTEMYGIGGNGEQRFGNGAEQNTIEKPCVLQRGGGNLSRHSKDGVKVRTIEELGFPDFDPLAPARHWHLGQWRFEHGLHQRY